MLICPGCKAVLKETPDSGLCPKCGREIRPSGAETEGPHAPTVDVTAEFAPLSEQPDTDQPAVTQEMKPDEKGQSLTIAPRKLSAKSIEWITGTWESAVARDPDPHSSLKVESKGPAGTASSLVVNLRGLRAVEEGAPRPAAAGADYELLQVIGKGGMGVVYSARQASVDRMVAVKMIRPKAAADPERRAKFLSEAVVTGDLDHPNIVPIYELGSDEHNALFYSMKRVQGTPWSQAIRQKSLSENLEILMKVADAVAFAHANGVVHRDLKPENVMLGNFGEVLVMDWGLALATASFRHSEFVGRGESMGGTPAYMAPEMVTGPFDEIGPACDVYLLGALLFEVVTGLRPHTGKTAQDCLLAAARNEIQPTDVTGELIEIAYRAMATDPRRRYASVQEFQAAVRGYESHMESVLLAARADEELAAARATGDYQKFSRVVFGFEEALAMWDGNDRARAGVSEARLAYAASAKEKGDFELGLSLLDANDPQQAPLRAQLEAAQRDRDARARRLTLFKRIAAALVVVVFGVISASLIIVAEARNQETAAKQQAIQDRDAAQKAEQQEKLARAEEERQRRIADAAAEAALKAQKLEEAAKIEEQKQKLKAIEAQRIAQAEREKAVLARQGEEQAAYVARIGMAAAKIEENAFDTAESLLAACLPETLRHWEWAYLKRLCAQGVNFPSQGTVLAAAFSPDGRWFVTAGGRRAQLWDPASGKPILAIDHPADIHAIAVSPDSRHLATGGADGVVRILRADNGQLVRELKGHTDRVLDLAFSPRDGRWLLSTSRDNTARLWETSSGRPLEGSPLVGHYGAVWSGAFAPDETRVVTGGADGKAIVWSLGASAALSTGPIGPQKVFLGHQGAVFACAFSPDGRHVASAGYDKRVLLWEPDQISNVELARLVAVGNPIVPQGSRALEGHAAPIRTLAFSPDGEYLLSAGDDNTVRVWNVVTGKPHAHLRGHSRPVLCAAISPDARQVVSGSLEGQIKLWDIVNFKEAPHGFVLGGHEDAILSAAFSPDGTQIVTSSRDHTARIHRADTGEPLRWLKEGHDFLASRAIYFSGGRRLLTAGGDNTARIWDAETGAQLHTIERTGRAGAIAVSRDSKSILTGRYVATAGPQSAEAGPRSREPQAILPSSPQIALWDLNADGASVQPRALANPAFGTGHPALVTVVAISPDGTRIFSGDDAGIGKLWDSATGADVATLPAHTSGVTDASFLPNGQLLTAGKDGTVARWDVTTGTEVRPSIALAEPERRDAFDTPVTAIAVSADGRRLLTLSEDRAEGARKSVVSLWDLNTATRAAELYRGTDRLSSIVFTADGAAALAAGVRPEGESAASARAGGFVRRFPLSAGRETTAPGGGPFLDFEGRGEEVRFAIEAPGGVGVLTVGANGAALWNPAGPAEPARLFKPHGGVTTVAFSPDGKHVATGSTDRRIKIWNPETARAVAQLPAEHEAAITCVAFSPLDAGLLLTGAADGSARIWDLAAREVRHVLTHQESGAPASAVRAATFSPDGQSILTAGDDAKLRVWDAATGKLSDSFQVEAPVRCALFSRDRRYILAGLENGQAVIFDVQSHRPLVSYSGHTDAVSSVAFSPDGRRALTGSRDRLVKIWEVDTSVASALQDPNPAADASAPRAGKELLTLRYHDQPITFVAFSPDGRSILTASLDGTAVVWPTVQDAARAAAN